MATRAPSRGGGRAGRIALAAAGWLLLGAVATVGVAWGGQLVPFGWGEWGRGEPEPVSLAPWPVRPPPGYPAPRMGLWRWNAWRHGYGAFEYDDSVKPLRAFSVVVVRDGLPLRAMEGRRENCCEGFTQERDVDRGLWTAPPVLKGEIVPLLPLWPGFAFNTLFYAAAGYVAARGVRALRRLARARRGRCPACGYSRAGLSDGMACPECGSGGGGTG